METQLQNCNAAGVVSAYQMCLHHPQDVGFLSPGSAAPARVYFTRKHIRLSDMKHHLLFARRFWSLINSATRATTFVIVALAWSTSACAQSASGPTVFRSVNVLPMDGERILEGQTVVIRDGRIAAVSPDAEAALPEGAQTIDGTGRYLLPGIAEMHGHIPSGNTDPQYLEDLLFLYVANGVTTVRGMQGGAGQLELARQVSSGEIDGPTLYLAGPAFSGGSIDSPGQAVDRVRTQANEGWHLLKILPGMSREEYDAMARTANELNIRFAGHVPADVGLEHAIDMRQETFDHLDGYVEWLGAADGPIDSEALNRIVHRTREAGAWVVPTMAVWEVLLGALEVDEVEAYAELQYLPTEIRDQWMNSHRSRMSNPEHDRQRAQRIARNRIEILRALNEGGVGILLGTDSPQQFSVPGFSTRRELDRMVAAGMSPYEILRSGTYNVGAYFRNQDAFGVIAPGMRADLILTRDNPLDDIQHVLNPDGVMTRGRWYDRATIDARLSEIADRYR